MTKKQVEFLVGMLIVGSISAFIGGCIGNGIGIEQEQRKAMVAGVGYWSTPERFIYGVPPKRVLGVEKEGK